MHVACNDSNHDPLVLLIPGNGNLVKSGKKIKINLSDFILLFNVMLAKTYRNS